MDADVIDAHCGPRIHVDVGRTHDGRTDGRVRAWAAGPGPDRVLDWGVGAVQALAFSPDGSLGAVAGRRGEVVVWDVDA